MDHPSVNLFDIPLVLDEIARHLSPRDLKHCVRVSHDFWTAFVPHLWRNIHFSSLAIQERRNFAAPNSPFLLTAEDTPFLRREYYHHAVRSIKLASALPIWPNTIDDNSIPNSNAGSEQLARFPSLVRFKFRNQRRFASNEKAEPEANDMVPRVLTFLATHRTLREIELSYLDVGSDFMQQFQSVIERLPGLTRLVLAVKGKLSLLDQLALLEMGQRLEKIHLSIDSSLYEYRDLEKSEMDHYEQRMGQLKAEDFKVKDLFLNTELFGIIMADYLRRCPLLERLIIRTLATVMTTIYKELADIIESCCPRLTHLDLRALQMNDSAQARIISACCPTPEQFDTRSGLESLKTRVHGAGSTETIKAILGHRLTLTSLCITEGKGLTAMGLQQITTSCVHLKSLAARVIFSDAFPVPMNEIQDQSWSCYDLKSFSVMFTDHCTEPGRESAMQYIRYIYEQVGAIISLEVLSFRMGRAGWVPMRRIFLEGLGHLYKLKRLRVFGFHKEEASVLERPHVETMLESWPKLEQLAGLLDDFRSLKLAQWLMQFRPDLELSALNDGL